MTSLNDIDDDERPIKDVQLLDGGLTLTYASFYQTIQQLHQREQTTTSSLVPPRRTSPAVCYVIVSATSVVWTVLTVVTATLVGLALLTPRWLTIDVAPINARAADISPAANIAVPTASSSMGSIVDYADAPTNQSMRPRGHRQDRRTMKRRTISVMLNVESIPPRSRTARTTSIGLFNECYASSADSGGFFSDRSASSKWSPVEDNGWETINYIARQLMLRSVDCETYVTGFDMPDDLFPDAWKSALILLSAAATLLSFTCVTALVSVCVQSLFGKSIFTVSGLLQSIAGQCLFTA
jgi:Lipoma HMGIC fusion partner-like protein